MEMEMEMEMHDADGDGKQLMWFILTKRDYF